MQSVNLVLMGFGNVGRAFARLLMRKAPELRDTCALDCRVTAVLTKHHGRAINPEGISLEEALRTVEGSGSLEALSALTVPEDLGLILPLARGQIFFEVTPLDSRTGEPALTHLQVALEGGVHAVTANKGPLVYGYRTLRNLAAKNGRRFLFEATVLDGAPVFSLFREALPLTHLTGFRGILNSTTNFILGQMETGISLDEAVHAAQTIGIAETDPSADVDGWDAAVKVAALANVLMDHPLLPSQVRREGIRGLTPSQVQIARKQGKPFKLVCQARAEGGKLLASVGPAQVALSDPLASVSGASSLLHFQTDTLEGLTITEHNPGPDTTAYGLLADLVFALRGEVLPEKK